MSPTERPDLRAAEQVAYEMKVFLHGAKMAPPVAPGWLAQIEKWRAALTGTSPSEPSQPAPPLDVERLTRAIHDAILHNERGGVDDSRARASCGQFEPMQRCRNKAEAIAAEYARLSRSSDEADR